MTASLQNNRTAQESRDPLAQETGIVADDMYRMSGLFMNDLAWISLPTDAHRLLHGLLHATCRKLPKWSPDVDQPEEGYRARSVVLRSTVGLRARNCNSNLREGIAWLASAEIFDWLDFKHGNEFVCWRFKDNVPSAILDQPSYGLLDASCLPSLKNVTDYQIYGLTSLVRRMRKPEFTFTVAHAAIWADHEIPAWSAVSSKVVTAIRRSCEHYGLTAFLFQERHGDLRGIDAVTVRFWRPGCLWKTAALARVTGPTVKCTAIDHSDDVTVLPEAFPALLKRLPAAQWRIRNLENSKF
ncbi:hypothetical protein [Pontivivens nitratireducens]|uniref:hypothetical protein n=1 Tax=Pontivivens nitratireducens TaxID=2758038 RepID=UPI00163A8AEF|nr:hypothetical protein [Pontibrevibacter nitratireducens]